MAVREVDERKIDTTINSSGSLEDGPRMDRSREFATKVTLWHQFRALFLKDLTLQSRAIGTNLCQLLTPIIFILFAGIMQVIFNHSSRAFSSINLAISGSNAYPLFPQDIGRVAVCEPEASFNGAPVPPEACRDEIFSFFDDQGLNVHFFVDFAEEFLPYNQSNKALINEIEFFLHYLDYYQNASVLPRQQVLFDLPFYYVGVSDEVNRTLKDLGSLTFEGSKKGFLGGLVPDDWYFEFSTNFTINPNWSNRSFDDNYTDEGPHISVPFLLEIESRDAMNKQLVEVIRNYNYLAHSSAQGYDQYERVYVITPLSQEQYKVVLQDVQDAIENKSDTNFTQIRPRGGIFINWFNSTGDMELENRTLLQYTMVAQDLALYSFHDLFMPDGLTNTEVHQRNNIINMMSNALFKYLTENVTESVPIATYIMPLPSAPMYVDVVIDVTTRLRGVLFPFAASFLLPVFISSVVKDKHEKHLIMMEQNGLSRWTYWLVTYIFHFLLYCVVFLVIFIFSFIFQIRLFTQTNGLVLILSFLLWGHAEVVLGFYLSNFFSRPRTATVVGYLLVIAGVVIALQLEALQIFPDDKTPFPLYMMYPPFAFYRILFYLTNACLNMRCHGIGVLDPTNGLNLVTTSMMYLGWSTIALIFVSIYLSYVLPSEYGVRKSPFFPLIAIFKGIRRLCINTACCKEHAYPIRNHELTPLPTDHEGEVEGVDEDVQAEKDILRDGLPDDVPVVMHQLQKEYPGSGGQPPHIAVHSMSLIIQRNECFGLLGPNGAGKTTLISVLTGLCEPTRGTARIAGYDISTDIHAIHRHLGVCPQFDIQNADLTAEEHLLFYARLKGVKLSAEKAVVNRALRQVNLYDARKRKSKALSGGMRRRLSVAMACIGNPDILILDKPTTGLDPASRRQVWEVIEAVKQERSVILTTDAMEEADHLCTRIGIMNFGRLRCLGTQTRLKARFGTGYQLQFHCAPGKVGEVEGFVRMHVPQATHLETFADSCTYKLAKEGLVVSELFQLFDSMRDQVGILNWGLKMTTLEDVFLNIVRHSHDTRTPTVHSRCPSWLPCPCYTQGVGT